MVAYMLAGHTKNSLVVNGNNLKPTTGIFKNIYILPLSVTPYEGVTRCGLHPPRDASVYM